MRAQPFKAVRHSTPGLLMNHRAVKANGWRLAAGGQTGGGSVLAAGCESPAASPLAIPGPIGQKTSVKNDLRRGAVAVEFACVAPLLLAIIVGLMQLSRVYSVQNSL